MTATAPVILAPSGRPARFELRNFYEAAQPSRARSWTFTTIQDSNKDLDRYTRDELAKHARHLYKNSPFICGLIERLVTYTIGTGINPIPATSDKAWNKKARKVWKNWAKRCQINSKKGWASFQRVICRSRFLDGEAFTVKTFGASGRPRVQGLQYHKVTGKTDEAENICDGITYDKFGRPSRYKVVTGKDTSVPYDAENIIHHYTPIFPGQKRGVTILASAINTARDVDDILALEKAAVKDASGKRDIIKTASGEAPNAEEMIRQARLGTTSEEPEVYEPAGQDYYKRVMGPETVVLQRDDEYTPYVSERPGPAWQGFMDFLSQTVCLSANLPPSFLLQIKVGGADTRRDAGAAQRGVEMWQLDLIEEFQDIYEYVIEAEINDGSLMGAPADWKETSWQTPRAITVDSGREAQSDREDFKLNLVTKRELIGKWGLDYQAEDDQGVTEAAELKEKITAAGMTIEEFVKLKTLDAAFFKAPQPQVTQ